jgi:hypothetical protein
MSAVCSNEAFVRQMLVAGASLSWARDDSACMSDEPCTRCGRQARRPPRRMQRNTGDVITQHAQGWRSAVGVGTDCCARAWPRPRRWHACTTGTPPVARPSARRDVGGLVEPFAFGGAAALAGLGNATQCAPMRQPRAGGRGGLRFVKCCALLRIISYYYDDDDDVDDHPIGPALGSDEQQWRGGSVIIDG